MGRENKNRTLDGVQSTLEIIRLQVAHKLANDQRQLNLKVHVHTLGAHAGPLAREQHRRRRLEEEKGLLGLGIGQLRNVITLKKKMSALICISRDFFGNESSRVVAANADNLAGLLQDRGLRAHCGHCPS